MKQTCNLNSEPGVQRLTLGHHILPEALVLRWALPPQMVIEPLDLAHLHHKFPAVINYRPGAPIRED